MTANQNRLKNQNKKLRAELKNAQGQMQNSLFSLVQGAYAQTNLTSFNPALRNNIYAPLTINWTLLMYMYKTHGVLQTAIDVPVLDSLRGGLEINSDELDADDIGELNDWMEENNTLGILANAMIWARLFGGGAVIINTDQDPSTPLNFDRKIRRLELYAANRWELTSMWKPTNISMEQTPWEWAAEKNSEFLHFYGEKIHKSRLIILSGKEAPYIIRWQLQGWGMSEYERMLEDFNSYIKTKNVIYDLLEEAKLDVYRLDGFRSQLASAGGTQKTQERLALMNQLKSFNNATVLDKNDEFEQKQLTFSGLAEMMKENRIGMASALRMPMTKLFGLSASGFNSGEDDIENYNAMVEAEVRAPLAPAVRTLLKLIVQLKFGRDLDIDFEFRPMRELSSLDEETVKEKRQNRYVQLYDRSLIDSKELGQMMEKDKLVTVPTRAADGQLDDHPEIAGFEEGAEEETEAEGASGNKSQTKAEKTGEEE